jgi:hypothetical protein
MTKRIHRAFLACLIFALGCQSRPTRVVRFDSPSPHLFYTVEIWEQSGAISSDFTRVFAHFDHDGHSDKVMFLDGAYLQLKSVRWAGENEATICISEGRINSFNETLTLKAGGISHTVRNFLDPQCRQLQP